VPAVAGEFLVGAGEEVVALAFVLADEYDVGRFTVVGDAADPPSSKTQAGSEKRPEGGAAPVALRAETHRAKQMGGNRWSETVTRPQSPRGARLWTRLRCRPASAIT
jgi:hypothetical protein